MSGVNPDDPILAELGRRSAGFRRVRYRQNRSLLLSVSRDGRTLNCHACFRDAPPRIVQAVADAVTASRPSSRRRAALRTLRAWDGTRRGLAAARRKKPRRRRNVNGQETAPLRALFRRLNREKFGGRLPEIPLRVSRRMTRSLGTVRYGAPATDGPGGDRGGGGGEGEGGVEQTGRTVQEIAISADLLRAENQAVLEDTFLHEMAHAEAWLVHGHKGHGRPWKRIARRVGCRPRAVNDVRVAGRSGRTG